MAEDAGRRPPEEPVGPTSPDDRARHEAWPAESDRIDTGPQRIPPGGLRHGPPPGRPAEPGTGPWQAAGPLHSQAGGRPRESAPTDSTRVMPPTTGRPGWPQEPPRERPPRPAGPEWSSQPSSSPNWAVAPAAAPPAAGWSYVDSIRTSELVPVKRCRRARAGAVSSTAATFGLVNLGPSPDELRQAELREQDPVAAARPLQDRRAGQGRRR